MHIKVWETMLIGGGRGEVLLILLVTERGGRGRSKVCYHNYGLIISTFGLVNFTFSILRRCYMVLKKKDCYVFLVN